MSGSDFSLLRQGMALGRGPMTFVELERVGKAQAASEFQARRHCANFCVRRVGVQGRKETLMGYLSGLGWGVMVCE